MLTKHNPWGEPFGDVIAVPREAFGRHPSGRAATASRPSPKEVSGIAGIPDAREATTRGTGGGGPSTGRRSSHHHHSNRPVSHSERRPFT
jgi:hypothetical protein